MDNETSRIAYDASVRAVQDQAGVLDGLRSRAGTILAAAALVSSFLGGQALRGSTRLELLSLTTLAIAAFVLSAVLALLILWPFEFRFSLSAAALINAVDEHEAKGGMSLGELYRVLALQLEWRYDENRRMIRWLLWAFEAAIVSLILEVGLWFFVLWRK
ncbi:MAG: hypothetical protein WAQ33_07200 [Gaiellaceae bacterium]